VIRAVWAVTFASLLAGCGTNPYPDGPDVTAIIPDFASAQIPPPPGVSPDSCWVSDISPAEIQTVTRQIEVVPARIAADGTVLAPARFQTDTAQEIVKEREELIFETPCPAVLTPAFIATLQRALDARGLYRGPVTGVLDIPTRMAIRRYQTAQGLPSGLLSMQSARALGLLATPRDQL
jgi:hypothetical protein